METNEAASCLESIGNPTRLRIFKHLVKAGNAGATVGEVQKKLGIPASTLSHHISKLTKVGIVSQERQSRELICRANYDLMQDVLDYLMANCCADDNCSTSDN